MIICITFIFTSNGIFLVFNTVLLSIRAYWLFSCNKFPFLVGIGLMDNQKCLLTFYWVHTNWKWFKCSYLKKKKPQRMFINILLLTEMITLFSINRHLCIKLIMNHCNIMFCFFGYSFPCIILNLFISLKISWELNIYVEWAFFYGITEIAFAFKSIENNWFFDFMFFNYYCEFLLIFADLTHKNLN